MGQGQSFGLGEHSKSHIWSRRGKVRASFLSTEQVPGQEDCCTEKPEEGIKLSVLGGEEEGAWLVPGSHHGTVVGTKSVGSVWLVLLLITFSKGLGEPSVSYGSVPESPESETLSSHFG